jgi:hypothetical protein
MKNESFFPNVFYQDDHGGLSLVSIEYNLWSDSTLSMGDKYKKAYERLVENGYVISINERLPTIVIDRYVTYDGRIQRENLLFAQGQDAGELLDGVPDDVYRDHYILHEIAG